jgi:hypothetical protein
MQWFAEEFMTGNATHDATRLVQNLAIIAKQRSALFLSLADGQPFATDHAIRQLQGLFARTVLIHDGRDHAAKIAEVELAALEGHDLHAGVTQLFPMHHRIECKELKHRMRRMRQHSCENRGLSRIESNGCGPELFGGFVLTRDFAGVQRGLDFLRRWEGRILKGAARGRIFLMFAKRCLCPRFRGQSTTGSASELPFGVRSGNRRVLQ